MCFVCVLFAFFSARVRHDDNQMTKKQAKQKRDFRLGLVVDGGRAAYLNAGGRLTFVANDVFQASHNKIHLMLPCIL